MLSLNRKTDYALVALADMADRPGQWASAREIAERRDAYEREYERTSQIIQSRFDQDVRKVFKNLREKLPAALAQLDRDLADLVNGYLSARGTEYRRSDEAGRVVFDLAEGGRFATGDARGLENAEALNLSHPLVQEAIADARAWPGGSVALRLPLDAPAELAALAGRSGVLAVALPLAVDQLKVTSSPVAWLSVTVKVASPASSSTVRSPMVMVGRVSLSSMTVVTTLAACSATASNSPVSASAVTVARKLSLSKSRSSLLATVKVAVEAPAAMVRVRVPPA